MPSPTDKLLLERYLKTRCDESFRHLVNRHLNLVHSVASRVTRNPDLARDVAQLVFTRLASHPARVPSSLPLPAWLHRTTRSLAANLVRSEERRKKRDLTAASHHAMNTEPTWQDLEPSIDSLIDRLPQAERAALVLRFYSGHSHAEVGRALGISEEAARKRIARPLEKLRRFLSKRGIATTTAFLATILPTQAATLAPAGLATSITTTVLSSLGTGATASSALTAIFAMTTTTKTGLAVAFALAVTGLATYVTVTTVAEPSSSRTTSSTPPGPSAPARAPASATPSKTERAERPAQESSGPPPGIDAQTWQMAGTFLSMIQSAPPESMVQANAGLQEKDLENLQRHTGFDEQTMAAISRLNAEYLATKKDIAVRAYEKIAASKDTIQEALALGMLSEKTDLSEEQQQHLDQLHERLDEDFEEPLMMMEDLKAWYENEELLSGIRGGLTDGQTSSFDRFVEERSDIANEGWAFERSQTLAEKLHLNTEQRQAVFDELYQKRSEDPEAIRELLDESQRQSYQPKEKGKRTFSFGFTYSRN